VIKKLLAFLVISIFAIVAIVMSSSYSKGTHSPIRIETRTGLSSNKYLFIYKNAAKIDLQITRPEKSDTNVLLSIAGAFTDLGDYNIDGLYICNGKTGNKSKVNHTLGGAIRMMDGNCTIFPTNKGALLNDSLIAEIESKKGALFQQIQMITNSQAARFIDTKLFQRRGIALLKNDITAIVESEKAMTLKTFADDLQALGVKNLLYTDMGAWDEGWYKEPTSGKIIVLGLDRSQTSKQSNWVVFRK